MRANPDVEDAYVLAGGIDDLRARLTQVTDDPSTVTSLVSQLDVISGELVAQMNTFVTQIQKMYLAFYGRAADPKGLDYWVSQLAKVKGELGDIIEYFADSDEADELYAGLTLEQQVVQIYGQLLGREPSGFEIEDHLQELSAGRSLGSLSEYILDSVSDSREQAVVNNRLRAAQIYTEYLKQHAQIEERRSSLS